MDTPDVSVIETLIRVADRLDQLADTAALMGDDDGAVRMHGEAEARRNQALELLDDQVGRP